MANVLKKEHFIMPEGVVYLDGNSLGPMPKSVPERVAGVMTEEWAQMLIRGWNKAGWMAMPSGVGDAVVAAAFAVESVGVDSAPSDPQAVAATPIAMMAVMARVDGLVGRLALMRTSLRRRSESDRRGTAGRDRASPKLLRLDSYNGLQNTTTQRSHHLRGAIRDRRPP